jgi:RHS repeat-associated protein
MRRVHPAGSTSTTTARYDYNAGGERIRTETYPSTGVTRVTLATYLPDGKLLGETVYNNNALAEQREYVWMDDTPVAMHATKLGAGETVTDSQTYYLHTDHRDTPYEATNSAGTLVWLFLDDLSPSGEGYVVNMNGGPISPINLRFPGQYFDSEAWLNYNYHRHYWPQLGRYTQPDPTGLEGGLNPYLYANGNPLAFTDPLGLQPRIAPLTQAVRNEFASMQAPALIAQIQRMNPSYSYPIMRPAGSGYTMADVQFLQRELERHVADSCFSPAVRPPQMSPYFEPPTNPPQLPPTAIPPGWRIREGAPTEFYPNGYWKLEKPMTDGSWRPINPSTMKPGTRPETHIEFPKGK